MMTTQISPHHHTSQYMYPSAASINRPFPSPSLPFDPMHAYTTPMTMLPMPPMNLCPPPPPPPPPPLFSIPPPFPSVLPPPSSFGYDRFTSYYQPLYSQQHQQQQYRHQYARSGGSNRSSSSNGNTSSSFYNKYYHSSSSSSSRSFSPRTAYDSMIPSFPPSQQTGESGDILQSLSQDDGEGAAASGLAVIKDQFQHEEQEATESYRTGTSRLNNKIEELAPIVDVEKSVTYHLRSSPSTEELERRMMGKHERKEQKELKLLEHDEPVLLQNGNEKVGVVPASTTSSSATAALSSSAGKGLSGRNHTGSHRDRGKTRSKKDKAQESSKEKKDKELKNKQPRQVKPNLEADFPTLVFQICVFSFSFVFHSFICY
jgi:hypothetical protein